MEFSQPSTSQTLQHITKRKLEKVTESIIDFGAKKKIALDAVSQGETARERLRLLLENAEKQSLLLENGAGISVQQIRRFLVQAEHDPGITDDRIQGWHDQVQREIEIKGRKLIYAQLFGKLCMEWTQQATVSSQSTPKGSDDGKDEAGGSQNTFLTTVKSDATATKQEQRKQWDQYAFTQLPRDQGAIDEYLKDLFNFTPKSRRKLTSINPLHQLQLSLGRFEETEPRYLTTSHVEEAIDALLRASSFTTQKRQELLNMRNRPEVLVEVADVLNMDLDSIETWNWEHPVELQLRRTLNGKFRVFYDEEIHEAILLHFIGMKWAVLMKTAFMRFFHSGAWTQTPSRALDKAARTRRDFFLGKEGTDVSQSVRANRRSLYQNQFFMVQLPSSMENYRGSGYDDGHSSARGGHRRTRGAYRGVTSRPKPKQSTDPMQRKDLLHRLASTELLVQTSVYGECTILQSDFKDFGNSIPHDTIFAVLKFLGVKGKWLDFFRKFLQPNVLWPADQDRLDIKDEVRSQRGRRRVRGVPMSHILSDALSEAILFCLDFAVSKATGGIDLHRMHDDLWFWGQEEVAIKAWSTIKSFSDIMGLDLNLSKTGCAQTLKENANAMKLSKSLPEGDVTWGLLKLDQETKSWLPSDKKIINHAMELDRQLGACTSVFAWIQAYNAYACHFITSNLGQPAACLGADHIDTIVSSLATIQKSIFGEQGSVQDELRQMIAEPEREFCGPNFDAASIPDAFFYLPLAIGGLGVQNPFVKPTALRGTLPADPNRLLEEAHERDEDDYAAAKKSFEEGTYRSAQDLHNNRNPDHEEEETFMPFEEFIRFKEETSPNLADAWDRLLEPAELEDVDVSTAFKTAVGRTSGDEYWDDSGVYEQWLLELYGKDMIDLFGGMEFAEKNALPFGMMESLKNERLTWAH